MNDPLSPGKQVLLRALDHITEIEEDTDGSVEYLFVAYAVVATDTDGDQRTTRGWDSTEHPHFVQAGLLREMATRIEREATEIDEDDD